MEDMSGWGKHNLYEMKPLDEKSPLTGVSACLSVRSKEWDV